MLLSGFSYSSTASFISTWLLSPSTCRARLNWAYDNGSPPNKLENADLAWSIILSCHTDALNMRPLRPRCSASHSGCPLSLFGLFHSVSLSCYVECTVWTSGSSSFACSSRNWIWESYSAIQGTVIHSHHQHIKTSISLRPVSICYRLDFSEFIVVLVGVNWSSAVGLISIFLMSNHVKYLLMYLLDIVHI